MYLFWDHERILEKQTRQSYTSIRSYVSIVHAVYTNIGRSVHEWKSKGTDNEHIQFEFNFQCYI